MLLKKTMQCLSELSKAEQKEVTEITLLMPQVLLNQSAIQTDISFTKHLSCNDLGNNIFIEQIQGNTDKSSIKEGNCEKERCK